jgi:hypothetical protein
MNYSTIASVFVFGFLVACSAGKDPKEETPIATSTSNRSCPDVATACASGCNEARARTYDRVKKCRSASEVVVGCNAPAERALDVGCMVRRSDGLVLMGSSDVIRLNADACPIALRELVERTESVCP